MSWVDYVSNLTNSGKLDKAAICGLDGSIWAGSPEFTPSTKEVEVILNGLKNYELLTQGVDLCGEHYIYLQSDETTAQAKRGQTGLTVAKASTCVIVGFYAEGKAPGNARDAVEAMRNYLVEQKF